MPEVVTEAQNDDCVMILLNQGVTDCIAFGS